MKDLVDLMLEARARSTDPQTSHIAAKTVEASALAMMVLDYLRHHPGLTSHEVAEGLGLSLVTVSPRMKPLELAGKIERGERRGGRTTWRAKCS